MSIKLMFTAFGAAMALTALPAFGDSGGSLEGQASYGVRLEGYVPVICRVAVDGERMTEFCNNGAGYQVWVDHAPGLVGAAIIVDGERVALSDGGSTLVSQSGTAAFRVRQVAVEADGLTAVSMRIAPL